MDVIRISFPSSSLHITIISQPDPYLPSPMQMHASRGMNHASRRGVIIVSEPANRMETGVTQRNTFASLFPILPTLYHQLCLSSFLSFFLYFSVAVNPPQLRLMYAMFISTRGFI